MKLLLDYGFVVEILQKRGFTLYTEDNKTFSSKGKATVYETEKDAFIAIKQIEPTLEEGTAFKVNKVYFKAKETEEK